MVKWLLTEDSLGFPFQDFHKNLKIKLYHYYQDLDLDQR